MCTADWIPAARIGRRPKGDIYCIDVLLMYTRPQAVDAAIERALSGRTVFVRRDDAPAVVEALNAHSG
jgi:hypothetical protein